MEDKQKIFAIGSRKIAEIKGWSQEYIASIIKDGKQGTVSSWLRGRTKFPADRMPEFSKIFGLTIEEILETGREELQPPTTDLKAQIREVLKEEKISLEQPPVNNLIDYTDPVKLKHIKVINEFPEPEEALEMNELAVQYVKKDPNAIRELIKYIKYQMSEIKSEYAIENPQKKRG